MDAAWVAAWAAVGTAVIYIVLGVFAAVQVLQARKTRELTYRPYVVVDYDFRRFVTYVSVKNIGQTPAANVVVTFDKPLVPAGIQIDPNQASVFTAPVPMVAPGKNLRVTLGVAHQLLGTEGVPTKYVATVKYWTLDRKPRSYEETYVLDLAQYADVSMDPKGIPELVEEVASVRKQMAKWTDGSRGLLANVTNRDQMIARRDRSYWHEQGVRIRKQEGWFPYLRWLLNRQLERYGWR